jgi:uncharacterized protein
VTFSIEDRTIFLTLAGSQAHGTAREGSDVDLRGVCVAPLSCRLSLYAQFEQHEGALGGGLSTVIDEHLEARGLMRPAKEIKTESVVYDITKFIGLCSNANPNALEILFANEQDWVFSTPWWKQIHDQRHRFLTKKIQQTFVGYAMAQLKKIRTHRSWLLAPPSQKPTRASLGLPPESTLNRDDQNRLEQAISEKIRGYGVADVEMPKATRLQVEERLNEFARDVLLTSEDELELRMGAVASHALEIPSQVISALNAERKYRAAMKQWDSYQDWKRQRNRARAELENKYGYDTKHAMHLVRLMRMGVETLETGEMHVRRPDAEELAQIRGGSMSFDELVELSIRLNEAMERARGQSGLPDHIDRVWADELAISLMIGHP